MANQDLGTTLGETTDAAVSSAGNATVQAGNKGLRTSLTAGLASRTNQQTLVTQIGLHDQANLSLQKLLWQMQRPGITFVEDWITASIPAGSWTNTPIGGGSAAYSAADGFNIVRFTSGAVAGDGATLESAAIYTAGPLRIGGGGGIGAMIERALVVEICCKAAANVGTNTFIGLGPAGADRSTNNLIGFILGSGGGGVITTLTDNGGVETTNAGGTGATSYVIYRIRVRANAVDFYVNPDPDNPTVTATHTTNLPTIPMKIIITFQSTGAALQGDLSTVRLWYEDALGRNTITASQ